eukprot:m.128205 g.128205  ORF g.128205 m.128205 type:complete len:436 (+) comp14559_c0_seq2:150-1457(+)
MANCKPYLIFYAIFIVESVQSKPIDVSGFVGLWSGPISASIMGPYNNNLTWEVKAWSEHDGLSISVDFEGFIQGSRQEFWLAQTNPSATWPYKLPMYLYCGDLRRFFSSDDSVRGTVMAPMSLQQESSSTKLVLCHNDYKPNSTLPLKTDCASLQKNIELIDKDTLKVTATLPSPAVHLIVVMHRMEPLETTTTRHRRQQPPTKFPVPCQALNPKNEDTPNKISSTKQEKSLTSPKCPFLQQKDVTQLQQQQRSRVLDKGECYVLNAVNDFRVEINMISKTILEVAISAKVPANGWLAIGFFPQAPLMAGADVVLGYQNCIQTLYANESFGAPSFNDKLKISNGIIKHVDGISTLSFQRALNTGHTAITANPNPFLSQLMWATGESVTNEKGNCDGDASVKMPMIHFRKAIPTALLIDLSSSFSSSKLLILCVFM